MTETIKRVGKGFYNAEATTESIRAKMVVLDGSPHLWKVLQECIFNKKKDKNSKKRKKKR